MDPKEEWEKEFEVEGKQMTLLPADIVLIKRGTLWMPFAPFVWVWQRVTDSSVPWSWAYHVEMVWDVVEDGYKALSMQPPLLTIVIRYFDEINASFYRLKDRPWQMDQIFWGWGNPKIDKELYILGYNTCGMPVRDFYREKFGVEMSPYPGPIEKFCQRSDKFIRVI